MIPRVTFSDDLRGSHGGVRDHVRIQMALEPALGDVVSELGTYRLYILPSRVL